MKNKSAQIVIDTTVLIVLGVLVLLVVAGIFISFNPNFLYKLLPDLSSESKDVDQSIEGADVLVASCKNGGEIVGFIGQTNSVGGNINLGSKGERETSLIYRRSDSAIVLDNGKLWGYFDKGILIPFTDGNRLGGRTILGKIVQGVVVMDPQYMNSKSQIFIDNSELSKPFSITVNDLFILDNANLEGYSYFCKPVATDVTEKEIIALAKMMQGEEGNQGEEAMRAAGYVAMNRWNYVQSKAGFGVSKGASLSQIVSARGQFYGYSTINDYSKSLNIAKEVFENKVSSDYSGYYFFGNNIPSKDIYVDVKMQKCRDASPLTFLFKQVGTTTLYLSNGNYASNCEIPVI